MTPLILPNGRGSGLHMKPLNTIIGQVFAPYCQEWTAGSYAKQRQKKYHSCQRSCWPCQCAGTISSASTNGGGPGLSRKPLVDASGCVLSLSLKSLSYHLLPLGFRHWKGITIFAFHIHWACCPAGHRPWDILLKPQWIRLFETICSFMWPSIFAISQCFSVIFGFFHRRSAEKVLAGNGGVVSFFWGPIETTQWHVVDSVGNTKNHVSDIGLMLPHADYVGVVSFWTNARHVCDVPAKNY